MPHITGDEPLTLEQHQLSTEGFNKKYGSKIIDSKILKINSIRFFIFQYQEGDEINLTFTPDFRNKSTTYCSIKYKKPDEEKAEKIFNTLLNNFRYKN